MFKRSGNERIAARAAAALAIDMTPVILSRPKVVVEQDNGNTESSEQVVQKDPANDGGELNADLPLSPEDTPVEEAPQEATDEPAALLLAGGYFRIRELYKPGTARLRGQEARSLRRGKE